MKRLSPSDFPPAVSSGFSTAFYACSIYFYKGPPSFREIVPAAAALGLVAFAPAASHPYDLCTTFLSCLTFLMLAQSRWRAFLFVFFLACVNKETALLTTTVFIVYMWASGQWRSRLFFALTSAQFLIFAVTKFTISYLLRTNPGELLEFHLFDINTPLFAQWVRVGFDPQFFLICCAYVVAIFYQWTRKPLILRSWLFLAVPLLSLDFFGVFNEWRQTPSLRSWLPVGDRFRRSHLRSQATLKSDDQCEPSSRPSC